MPAKMRPFNRRGVIAALIASAFCGLASHYFQVAFAFDRVMADAAGGGKH